MFTCVCGACFEVDDSLAGQEILCPECRQPLRSSAAECRPRVTSAWALASLLLALLGAFTVVGTIVAALLGIVALMSIARQRDRVTGVGFAVSGICLSILFTVLTIVALNAGDLFGLESWLRQRTMSQKIDTSGPLEVVQGTKGFAITRPSEKWGQVQDKNSGDPVVGAFQNNLDLLLMPLARHAFIDVQTLLGAPFQTLDQCEAEVLADLERPRRPPNLFDDEDNDFRLPVRVQRLGWRQLNAKDGMTGRELELELSCAGKAWHFLIRLYQGGGNAWTYVVRAYAPKRGFATVRGELETALDSFRILRR